jgi:predicted NBD/HSP70 family sugar kinase
VGVFRVGLVNLRNELLENELCWFDPKTPYEQVFENIADRLEAIIKKSGVDRNKIIGLGVGPPGVVDYSTGTLNLAPNLNWENIPLRDWFSKKMDMPVVVENNTRAMALAESYFGSGKDSSSLLFVYGRYGVGSGIVVDRQVFRGSRFSAGEIGHTLLVINDSADCDIESCTQLESLVSEKALLDQAEAFTKNDPEGVLAVLLADQSYERKIDALIEAGRQGDPNAIAIFNRASRLLGIALTNLVNILNPERIVLGGMYWQAKDLILPTITDIVTHSVVGEIGEKVIIEGTAFGWRAGLTGACTIALIRLFYSNSEEQ